MSAIELATSHVVEIYDLYKSDKRKELLREQLGRFITFKNTDDFLAKYNIKGIEKFTKQEKNIFADLLNDKKLYAEDIIKKFNYATENSGKELENRILLFKNLKMMSEFLKATPYDYPDFMEKVYSKVIEWSFLGDQKNITTLRKGFNLYVDKKTLTDFLSINTHTKNSANENIIQSDMIYQEKEKKETLISGAAGLISFFTMGGLHAELSAAAVPKVLAVVGGMTYGASIVSLVPYAVGAYAFYKTFQMMNTAMKKFVEINREKLIVFTSPDKMNTFSAMNNLLSERIFKDILYDSSFKIDDKKNNEYIELCIFINEKLINTEKKVSLELQKKLNLTDKQVDDLNYLDRDRIHEIANVRNPHLRKLMLLNELDPEKENFIKQVSNAEILLNSNKQNGSYFEKHEINNLSPELKNKINNLPSQDKLLVDFYLNLFTSKEGKCQQALMISLENSIDVGDNLLSTLKIKLNDEIQNRIKPEEKNKELSYFKRISCWALGNSEDHLDKVNENVAKLITKKSQEMNCRYINRVIELHPDLSQKIKLNFVKVVYQIGKLRDQTKQYLGMDTSKSITLK